jgi:hypothetical protein
VFDTGLGAGHQKPFRRRMVKHYFVGLTVMTFAQFCGSQMKTVLVAAPFRLLQFQLADQCPAISRFLNSFSGQAKH